MFSKLSIIIAGIGAVLLSFSYIYSTNFEILMTSGLGLLFISLFLSFGAVFKREQGKFKFFPVIVFFFCSFIITWYDPFQIVRLLTWIEN
ncbi:hypothetical protein ACQKMV_05470 [Lysinibacillus sp. NPDC094403]|uniref:hypothetical protein n=1 Tax=Lysinibacillus sp. NPDC094403 TaxID=3390581 RepID=UPI003D02DE83